MNTNANSCEHCTVWLSTTLEFMQHDWLAKWLALLPSLKETESG